MKRVLTAFAVLAIAWSPTLSADRLTDKDLKDLIDRVYQERDRFEDRLDGDIKHNVVRGASGEVKVDKFLDDFQEDITKLKDRIKPDYSAGAEAAQVLRKASAIDQFMRSQRPGLDGASEWNRLADSLKLLAGAYGAAFPLAEGAAVRRLGDREVANLVDKLAENGDRVKKSLDNELKKDKTVDAATRQSMVDEVDQFTKDAKDLRDRLKDGSPSSSEAERLMNRASAVNSMLKARQTPASASQFASLAASLQQVAGAYALTSPAVR